MGGPRARWTSTSSRRRRATARWAAPVEFAGTVGVDPWYEVAGRRGALAPRRPRRSTRPRAPFADELDALVPGAGRPRGSTSARPPRSLRTCHRDLWADNVRGTRNRVGCASSTSTMRAWPTRRQELALVLVEFSGDRRRAHACDPATRTPRPAAPGRVEARGTSRWRSRNSPTSSRRVAGAGSRPTSDDERADNEAWVHEFLDRPLTRDVIERLLAD